MTAPTAKLTLQRKLLDFARLYKGELPGWLVNQVVGVLPHFYGEETVRAWVLELLQPMGPEDNQTVWLLKQESEVRQ